MSAGISSAAWAWIIATSASAISQGQATRKRAKFQAAVGVQQAGRQRLISAAEEEDFRRRQSAALAQFRAAGGAAGIEAGTGTALITAKDFAAETELQALRIRAGGETQATRLEQQAELTLAGGKAAEQRGFFRAGSSLLSGASGFAKD